MAKGSHLNTYQIYKAGTKRLTTWLVQSAKLCGVTVVPSTSDKYQIPLGQFLHLARTITESKRPNITVPREILATIKTVIALRIEAGVDLANLTGGSSNEASDASHSYFVSILEQVLEVLSPQSSFPGNESQGSAGIKLANTFEALQVEETLPDTGAPEASSSKKKSKAPATQQYEIEDSSANNSLLAILAFLKDYEGIERVVKAAWKHYRDGSLGLMAASVTTDTAYGILKRSSEELLSSLGGQKTYQDICSMFVEEESRVEGENTGIVPAGVAQYLAIPVESILSTFAADPSAKPTVVYDAKFGNDHTDQKWTKKTAEGQHDQDKTLLMEYLPVMAMFSRDNWGLPTQDEMTSGLQTMIESKNGINGCPMYAIFATKLFLGIHEVLGVDHVHPVKELLATAKCCISTIDGWFKFSSKNEPYENWPASSDKGLRNIRSFAQQLIDGLDVATPDALKPQPSLFFKRNPIVCGLLIMNISMLLQLAGQSLVGAYGSAVYPIHLYNACRQSGGLDREWEDAEYIYQLHTPQRIFVGGPPADPQDFHKRVLLMLGASATNFAANRRQGGKQETVVSKKGPRGLKTTMPVREVFQHRYIGDKNAALNKGNIDAMMAVAKKVQRTCPPLTDIEQLMREIESQQQELSPVQLLTCVREGVAAEEMHLNFDYFGVHERGITLLRDVRTAVHEDLVRHCGDPYLDEEALLPHIVAFIFEIVARGEKEAGQLKLSDYSFVILNKVSGVMKEFLERGDTSSRGLMGAKSATRAVQFAREDGRSMESVQIWDPQNENKDGH
jgi:hypothetical protein